MYLQQYFTMQCLHIDFTISKLDHKKSRINSQCKHPYEFAGSGQWYYNRTHRRHDKTKKLHLEIVACLFLICTNSRTLMLESKASHFNGNMFQGSRELTYVNCPFTITTNRRSTWFYVLWEHVTRSCYVGGPSNKKSTMLNRNVMRESRAMDPLPWCMAAGCSPTTKRSYLMEWCRRSFYIFNLSLWF